MACDGKLECRPHRSAPRRRSSAWPTGSCGRSEGSEAASCTASALPAGGAAGGGDGGGDGGGRGRELSSASAVAFLLKTVRVSEKGGGAESKGMEWICEKGEAGVGVTCESS